MLYLLNPRTGSSALAKHLVNEFGGVEIPSSDLLNEVGGIKLQAKHNTIDDLIKHCVLKPEEIKDYVIFTNVRNPYDSLVSLYQKHRYRYKEWRDAGNFWVLNSGKRLLEEIDYCQTHTFNQWIVSRYWKATIKSLLTGYQASIHFGYPNHCTDILHMETLNEDFAAMLQRHNISGNPVVPVFNKTESKQDDYRSYYTRLSAWMVQTVHQQDFEKYGYRKKL